MRAMKVTTTTMRRLSLAKSSSKTMRPSRTIMARTWLMRSSMGTSSTSMT